MGLFRKKIKQEHKIMLQHDRAAGVLQPRRIAPHRSARTQKTGA